MRAWPGPGAGTSTSSHCITSGPPVLWIRMALVIVVLDFLVAKLGSAQMLLEERRGALVGLRGGFLVIMVAADARERVVLIGIDVDGDALVALERIDDLLLRLRRHELVLAGDVHQIRVLDVLGLVQQILDADAVITDAAVDIGACHPQIAELSPQ